MLRPLLTTHRAAIFRQTWNLLQWLRGDDFNHRWQDFFEACEDLRQLTLWLGIDWDRLERSYYKPDSLQFGSSTIEAFLMHLAVSYSSASINTDDDSPEAVNRRATVELVECLRTIIAKLRPPGNARPRRGPRLLLLSLAK